MVEPMQDHQASPQRPGVREAREDVPHFLRRARFLKQARRGSSVRTTFRHEAPAGLHPPSAPARLPRQPGALRGTIRLAADFETLPSDVLAAIEGEE